MSNQTFDSLEEALKAHHLPVLHYCRVNGSVFQITEFTARHSAWRPVGLATFYAKYPEVSLVMGSTVEIEAGYPGLTRRVFLGTIPYWEGALDYNGEVLRVEAVGEMYKLRSAPQFKVMIPGPVSLKDSFRGICEAKAVMCYSDDTVYPNGDTIMLGGNDEVNDGDVLIDTRTGYADFLTRSADLFGYNVFDAPEGTIQQARITGIPDLTYEIISESYDLDIGSLAVVQLGSNLRAGPGTGYAVLDSVSSDSIVKVIDGPVINNSGFTDNRWYEVDVIEGLRGWISGRISTGSRLHTIETEERVFFVRVGENAFEMQYSKDIRQYINNWTVEGIRFTDVDGGSTLIRSTPSSVVKDPILGPDGVASDSRSNPLLVRNVQADGARNALEINYGAPWELYTWKFAANPDMQPGDVIVLHNPNFNATNRLLWLVDIVQSVDQSGYIGNYIAWVGSGTPIKRGNDCATKVLTTDIIHLGNQTISWYADPTSDGIKKTYFLTQTEEEYSSIRVKGKAHGTNTYNEDTASTGSGIEIWQLEDPTKPESGTNELKRIGFTEFPTLREESKKKRNYSQDKWWTKFSLPVTGTIKLGAFQIVLLAGENDDGRDDFEVKELTFEMCGIGRPIIVEAS